MINWEIFSLQTKRNPTEKARDVQMTKKKKLKKIEEKEI